MPVSEKCCTFAPFLNNLRPVKKTERIYNSHLRQLHFIEAVNKIWKKSPPAHQSIKKICALAASSPAPKFYITPKNALSKYYEFKSHGTIKNVSDITRRMYLCIFELFEQKLAQNNNTEFKYSVMQDVLDSAAPSFFILPDSAYFFYCRAMKYKRSLNRK